MWVSDLLDKVFTKIKYNLKPVKCSTENENVVPTTFPTVYVRELEPVETGQDLNNIDTVAVIYTVQTKVWSKSETECKDISYSIIETMKGMRFNVIGFPDIQTQDNISFAVIRFRRLIAGGDRL